MSFKATILTLYPEMFPGLLGQSLSGKALENGVWALETVQIRDFAEGKHRNVDDTPSGGGAGMVMRADVLARAIDSVARDARPRLLLSPRGKPLTQDMARKFSKGGGLVLVCGRFEGVDQRVIDSRELEEVSTGDYILSGGEPAAMILLDAIVRLLPGVMGNDQSGASESFEGAMLEYPHYTRPQVFEGISIPEVLTSGNHAKIEAWRREQALALTTVRRPDLLKQLQESDVAKLRKLEESLWQQATRCDLAYQEQVFAADFFEFGRSGRVYERSELLMDSDRAWEITAKLTLPKFSAKLIAAGLALVTYRSEVRRGKDLELANRTSLWSRGGKFGWQLRFHQGTPLTSPESKKSP